MTKTSRILLVVLSALLVVLAACGDGSTPTPAASPTPMPTPTPTPRPIDALLAAGDAMQALETASFVFTRTGAPVAIYLSGQSLQFNGANGIYSAPDRVQANATVGALGIVLEIGTIVVEDEQWITEPLTRNWIKLPPDLTFNPAIIFDAERGWRSILSEDLQDVVAVGSDSIEGVSYNRYDATVLGDRIRVVTAAIVGEEQVTLQFWVDPVTSYVGRIAFETGDPANPSEWTLTFGDFNEPVTIERPAGQ